MYRGTVQAMKSGYISAAAQNPGYMHRSVNCRHLEEAPMLREVEGKCQTDDGRWYVTFIGQQYLVRICKDCDTDAANAQEWMTQGACATLASDLAAVYSSDLSPKRLAVKAAKRRCETCPVKGKCLEVGMSQPSGIWGGLTAAERLTRRKAARRTRANSRRKSVAA